MKESGQELRTGGFAAAVGLLGILVSTALFAWLMDREMLALEYMDLAAAAALIFGGLLAGFICGRGEERWIRAVTAAVGMVLSLLLINLIGFDGAPDGLLPCTALVLGSVAAAALVMGDRRRAKRRKYQNKKYRTG